MILPSFSAPALSVDDVSYSISTARSPLRRSNRPSAEMAVSSHEPSMVSADWASLSLTTMLIRPPTPRARARSDLPSDQIGLTISA